MSLARKCKRRAEKRAYYAARWELEVAYAKHVTAERAEMSDARLTASPYAIPVDAWGSR